MSNTPPSFRDLLDLVDDDMLIYELTSEKEIKIPKSEFKAMRVAIQDCVSGLLSEIYSFEQKIEALEASKKYLERCLNDSKVNKCLVKYKQSKDN